MAVELTLELTLNCHSVLPLSASRARNSPVSLPVNISPPSVANMPAALGASVNGASHFFSPVTGLIATKAPTTSPGLNVGLRATTPVDTVPRACGFDGASLCIRGTFHGLGEKGPGVGLKAMGPAVGARGGGVWASSPAQK